MSGVRSSRGAQLAVAWLALGALGAAGCARAPTVSEAAMTAPLSEARDLDQRITDGTIDGEGLARRAQLALFFDADDRRTRALLARAAEAGHRSPEAALLACQVATLDRRYDELEARCLEVLERYPSHPAAEEAAALVSVVFDQTPDADARIAAALARARARCQTRDGLSICAGLAYLAGRAQLTVAGQGKDAGAYEEALLGLGALRRWRVCGPVANDSPTGFRQLRGVLFSGAARSDTDTPCVERSTREADLRPLAYSRRGVHLLEAEVRVARTGRVTLVAQIPRLSLMLVDGHLVVDHDPWRERVGPVQLRAFELSAGWHRITLATAPASVEDGVAMFFLDDRGRSAVDATRAAPGGSVARARARPPTRDPAVAATQLARELDLARRPWQALRLAWLQAEDAYLDGTSARRLTRALTAAYPQSGLAWLAHERAAYVDAALSPSLRDAERRRALETALEHRPAALLARYRLALLDFDERPDAALAMMRALVAERPDYVWGQRRLHEMLARRGLPVAARDPLEAALRLAPGESSLAFAVPFYQRHGAIGAARAAREARLDRETKLASARRAEWLVERGDPAGALRAYDALLAIAPDLEGAERVYTLARDIEGWPALRRRVEARLEAFPNDAQSAHWLVRAARASGDDAQLDRALAAAHAALPGDPRWERHRLRALGVEVAAAVDFESSALIEEFRREVAVRPDRYQGHSYVYVLDAAERIFHQGGGSFLITHQLLQVLSKEAVSQLGEVAAPPGVEQRMLRVIKADGRVVEPETAHGGGATSLSDLEVGDFLETRTLEEAAPRPFEGSFSERFFFASQAPMFLSTYAVTASPEQLAALSILQVGIGAPTREQRGARTRLRFTARGVDARRAEPFAGPVLEHLPHVTVTMKVDVELYASRAADRAALREAINDEVVAFAREATRGQSGARAKLTALARALAERVSATGAESDPATTLSTGRGDRLALLRVACLAAGLDARLMAAHHASPLPVVDWADQELDELFLLVEADQGPLPIWVSTGAIIIGGLPPELAGGTAVEVDPAPSRLGAIGQTSDIPGAWMGSEPHQVELEAQLDAGGALTGHLEMIMQPPVAGVVRTWVRMTPRQSVEQTIEGWLGMTFPGLVLEQLEIAAVDDELSPLSLRVGFRVARYAQLQAGALVVDRFLPSLGLTLGGEAAQPAAYLRLAARETALYLSPHHERSRVRIALPAGAQVLTLPAAFEEQGRFGRYAQRARVEADTVVVEREVEVPYVRVTPEEYPVFRQLGERVAGKTAARLVVPLGDERSRATPGPAEVEGSRAR